MEGVVGTQCTIDNTAGFVTACICVGLSLRRGLLTASSDFGVDLGGADGGGTSL